MIREDQLHITEPLNQGAYSPAAQTIKTPPTLKDQEINQQEKIYCKRSAQDLCAVGLEFQLTTRFEKGEC
jgi:hypothetical protein